MTNKHQMNSYSNIFISDIFGNKKISRSPSPQKLGSVLNNDNRRRLCNSKAISQVSKSPLYLASKSVIKNPGRSLAFLTEPIKTRDRIKHFDKKFKPKGKEIFSGDNLEKYKGKNAFKGGRKDTHKNKSKVKKKNKILNSGRILNAKFQKFLKKDFKNIKQKKNKPNTTKTPRALLKEMVTCHERSFAFEKKSFIKKSKNKKIRIENKSVQYSLLQSPTKSHKIKFFKNQIPKSKKITTPVHYLSKNLENNCRNKKKSVPLKLKDTKQQKKTIFSKSKKLLNSKIKRDKDKINKKKEDQQISKCRFSNFIRSKFRSFISQSISKDSAFREILVEVKEFFLGTCPNSWRLGFETSHHFYQRKEQIRETRFGEFYQVRQILTNQTLMIKKICKNARSFDSINYEVKILKAINNPKYILPFLEKFEDEKNHFLVSDYQLHTHLSNFFEKNTPFIKKQQIKFLKVIFYKVMRAVHYVHSCGIAHRAICPENIFISKDMTPLLFNFEHSAVINRPKAIQSKIKKSYCFESPEFLIDREISTKAMDTYSCGRILEWMFDQKSFSFDKNEEQFLKNSDSISFFDLKSKLLEKSVSKRISLPEAMKHEWFDSIKTCPECQFVSSDLIEEIHFFDSPIHEISLDSKEKKSGDPLLKLKVFSFGPEEYGSNLSQKKNSPIQENGESTFDRLIADLKYHEHKMKKIKETCSTHNTNKENKSLKLKNQQAVEKEVQVQRKEDMVVGYLQDCGFPKKYLEEILFSGSADVFSHAGACFKILLNRFNP